MDRTPKHRDMVSDAMTKSQFVKEYDRNDGFVVRLLDTDLKLTFAWKDVVQQLKDILFFGSPRALFRSFDSLFLMKSDEQYIFHVFKELAKEYWGDATASSQLYAVYLKRRVDLSLVKLASARNKAIKFLWKEFQEQTLTQQLFIGMFDSLCKNEFWQCATEMNDYGKELVLEDNLERFMWAA